MPAHMDYDYFMLSYLHWNLYIGPLLLALGIILQVYFLLRPNISFFIALIGAVMLGIVAYMDSDIFLFVGQIFILILLWAQKEKK